MMLEIARSRAEYRASAQQVKITDVSSARYYGEGYQDIQTRVPWIDNTCQELKWQPTTGMRTALEAIFDAYADDIQQARELTTIDVSTALGEATTMPAQALS